MDNVLEINCPIWQLKKNYSDLPYPMDPAQFNETVLDYWNTYKDDKRWDHRDFTIIDGVLRAMTIKVRALGLEGQTYEYAKSLKADMESVVSEAKRFYPRGISQVWEAPFDEWAIQAYEDSLYQNALQGMVCSMLFAYIVLFVTT